MCLLLIGTGIDSINNKTVENDYQNNSETQEKDQSKNKSTIEISKSVTEKSRTNLIGSTTSTTVSIPQKKLCAAQMKLIKLKKQQTHILQENQIIWGNPFYCSNDQKIDPSNKSIRSKKNSDYHDIEAFEFLDHINVDNSDFDDDVIDYVEESIQSCYILKYRGASY